MAVAVITGANAGIGLAFASKLLAKGSYDTVFITGRSQKRCEETVQVLKQSLKPNSPVTGDQCSKTGLHTVWIRTRHVDTIAPTWLSLSLLLALSSLHQACEDQLKASLVTVD